MPLPLHRIAPLGVVAIAATLAVTTGPADATITAGLPATPALTGSHTIKLTATDAHTVRSTELIVNGQVVDTDTTAPYTLSVDTTGPTPDPTPTPDAPAFLAPAVTTRLASCTTDGNWRTSIYQVVFTGGQYSAENPRLDFGWNNGPNTWIQESMTGWPTSQTQPVKVILWTVRAADPGTIIASHVIYGGETIFVDPVTCERI
jgi:hypothetical protein